MASASAPVVIVGSINMDLVARVPRVPAPGETVLGRDFTTIPGGKGANQAVAVARLGGSAFMVGRVGDDDFGRRLVDGLLAGGVDCGHVRPTPGAASGIAMIVVEDAGQNAITVASGANFQVTAADVDAAESLIRQARICLVQLELPLETVLHTIALCRRHGVETILDTAPAPSSPVDSGLFAADVVTPNETEAAAITGLPANADPREIAASLAARGSRSVVLKLGARGAFIRTDQQEQAIPGFQVRVVDTTAAGDAFTAALAVARSEGRDLPAAVRFANAAGALACTVHGAQPSMPTRTAVDRFLDG